MARDFPVFFLVDTLVMTGLVRELRARTFGERRVTCGPPFSHIEPIQIITDIIKRDRTCDI